MTTNAEKTSLANWRPGATQPYESLWSILHKFCAWNYALAPTVLKTYRRPGIKAAVFRTINRKGQRTFAHDLRFQGAFNLELLSASIGIGLDWIANSTLDGVGPRHCVRKVAAPYLRYCPFCIEHGFHATQFQLHAVVRCPIHRRPLDDCCPKCQARIPYALPARAGYSCECGRTLWWRWNDRPGRPLFTDASQKERLNRQAQRHLQPNPEFFSARFCPRMVSGTRKFQALLDRLSSEVSPTQCAVNVTSIGHHWGKKLKGRRWPTRPVEQAMPLPENHAAFQQQLWSVFCRVERMCVSRMPKRYRGVWLRPERRRQLMKQATPADMPREVVGYLVWRAHWLGRSWWYRSTQPGYQTENNDSGFVFRKYRGHARPLRPRGSFTIADEWAHLHVFAMVAVRTFELSVCEAQRVRAWRTLLKRRRWPFLDRVRAPIAVLDHNPQAETPYALRIFS